MAFSLAGDSYETCGLALSIDQADVTIAPLCPAIVMPIASMILVYWMGFISSVESANKQSQPSHGMALP